MNCLIIAGGFNTRIDKITKGTPKGLLDANGEKIISNLLDKALRLRSIDNYALITNQKYLMNYDHFLQSKPKYEQIKLISNGVDTNQDRLGAIGDILFAIRKLRWNDDLLILPSDTLINIELSRLIQFFNYHHKIINVVTDVRDKMVIANKLGCVQMEKNKIVDFQEKPTQPKTTLTSVPIYIYPQDEQSLILSYSEKGFNLDSPGAIIPWLLKQTQVLGFKVNNSDYLDIGTPQNYKKISAKK